MTIASTDRIDKYTTEWSNENVAFYKSTKLTKNYNKSYNKRKKTIKKTINTP